MPQLSPMLSFLIFVTILFFYIVLLSGLSKKFPFIHQTKMSKSFKSSLKVFK